MSDQYVILAGKIVEELVGCGVDVHVALNFVSSKVDEINELEPFVYHPANIRIDPAAVMERRW